MVNTTNPEAWAAQERLRFIERSLWWRGSVNRRDLRELFGISLAQASSDLQRYLELNPSAARYDLKAKTYRGEPGMGCRLHEPKLEDAISLFLQSEMAAMSGPGLSAAEPGRSGDRAAGVVLPLRRAAASVERGVFLAVVSHLWLEIEYASLSGRQKKGLRRIAPRAFAHDGNRWHLRAWCEDNGDYRDFVLSRIRDMKWPLEEAPGDLPPDKEWETFEELILIPNSKLPKNLRESVAWDFGMLSGKLRFKVRRAMRKYTLLHLGISPEGLDRLPPLLTVVATKK